jgi:hypothetical protein
MIFIAILKCNLSNIYIRVFELNGCPLQLESGHKIFNRFTNQGLENPVKMKFRDMCLRGDIFQDHLFVKVILDIINSFMEANLVVWVLNFHRKKYINFKYKLPFNFSPFEASSVICSILETLVLSVFANFCSAAQTYYFNPLEIFCFDHLTIKLFPNLIYQNIF